MLQNNIKSFGLYIGLLIVSVISFTIIVRVFDNEIYVKIIDVFLGY